MVPDPIWRRGRSALGIAAVAWTVCRDLDPRPPSSMVLPVYRREAGFLQGVTLSPMAPPSARLHARVAITLPGAPARRWPPRRDFDEVRWSLLLDVPFPRLSRAPFLSRSNWPPGSCIGGGIPHPMARSPYRPGPPAPLSRPGFSKRFPIPRSTWRRDIPSPNGFKTRSVFASYEAADL